MTVQNFMKIVQTVFEGFEIFMKRSGEKKQKNDTIAEVVDNFFRLLKIRRGTLWRQKIWKKKSHSAEKK